jgi:hypothetical protein
MAKVSKLQILPGGWEFKITGSPGDFARTIDRLKAKVPKEMRSFCQESGTWTVSNRYLDVMSRLFDNFESEVEAIVCQGVLF